MAIDDAGKGRSGPLPYRGLGLEVFVLGEEAASELGGTIENLGVRGARATVFLYRQDIDTPSTQTFGNRPLDVLVKEEFDAQSL